MRQRLLVKVQLIGDQDTIEKRRIVAARNLQRVLASRQCEFHDLVAVTVAVNLVPVPGISLCLLR